MNYDMPVKPSVHRLEVRYAIQASVSLAVSCYYASGGRNTEYIGGILSLARAMALSFGLSWLGIVAECKMSLGADVGGLLDAALSSAAIETD